MKKYVFLTFCFTLNVLLLSSCSIDKKKSSGRPLSLDMVDAHGVRDFYSTRNHIDFLQDAQWDNVSCLVAYSVLQTFQQYPYRRDLLEIVRNFADFNLSTYGDTIYKGNELKNKKRVVGIEDSNLDDLAGARIFFGLYKEMVKEGDELAAEKYRTAAELCRNKLKFEHKRIPDNYKERGGFFHKAAYPYQMWLEGLYAGAAIYAMYEDSFDNDEIDEINNSWHDIAQQFTIIYDVTFDNRFNLCYHAFSAKPNDPNSFWIQKHGRFSNCSNEFFARAIAYYFAALVDVLEIFPRDHKDYNKLLECLKSLAIGIKSTQDPKTHLWFQLMTHDETFVSSPKGDQSLGVTYNNTPTKNFIESSASCLFTYSLFKATRLNLLNKEEYLPIANKAYNSLLSNVIYYEGYRLSIGKICSQAGLGPRRDAGRTGTSNYYLAGRDVAPSANEGTGISAFILASLEKEKADK